MAHCWGSVESLDRPAIIPTLLRGDGGWAVPAVLLSAMPAGPPYRHGRNIASCIDQSAF